MSDRRSDAIDADSQAAIDADWQAAIDAAGETLRCHGIIRVPCDSAGWVDSGIEVNVGETVTLLSTGSARVSEDPDISMAANLFLWWQIGPAGQIAKFPARTDTFTAQWAGNLRLVAHFPGAWLDESGGLDPDWPRTAASGAFTVLILIWKDAVDNGLARFAAFDKTLLGLAEHARILTPIHPPHGWHPLWRVGATEVYRETSTGSGFPRIVCRCADDAGIIRFPAEIALDETTRLSWRWRVTELPSKVAEDQVPTHDYLSIAVEFDNGLDLTYMWSAALPVGSVFRCPLPWWMKRETHQVVRSGRADQGRWLDEEQPVLADYVRAIGGAIPARITGIWLIAVAAFQRGRGQCEYQAIGLSGAGGRLQIGP